MGPLIGALAPLKRGSRPSWGRNGFDTCHAGGDKCNVSPSAIRAQFLERHCGLSRERCGLFADLAFGEAHHG